MNKIKAEWKKPHEVNFLVSFWWRPLLFRTGFDGADDKMKEIYSVNSAGKGKRNDEKIKKLHTIQWTEHV